MRSAKSNAFFHSFVNSFIRARGTLAMRFAVLLEFGIGGLRGAFIHLACMVWENFNNQGELQ